MRSIVWPHHRTLEVLGHPQRHRDGRRQRDRRRQEAKRHAIACYLAYRRDGGENHSDYGRLVFAVTQKLRAGDLAGAASLLHDNAATYKTANWRAFIRALEAIVAGSHDHTTTDVPELLFGMAAEILFLIETLEKARVAPAPRAGSSTKSPPADRRRLSLMRSPALAYFDMACL